MPAAVDLDVAAAAPPAPLDALNPGAPPGTGASSSSSSVVGLGLVHGCQLDPVRVDEAVVLAVQCAVTDRDGSSAGRQLNPASLQEALVLAAQCAAADREFSDGKLLDSTWDQVVKMLPILSLVAQREYVLPPRFKQTMEICVACLPRAVDGYLQRAGRLADFLESPDAEPTLAYLEWLEVAVRSVRPVEDSSCRTVPVSERVWSSLGSWPSECKLLRQAAVGLWAALLRHCPVYLQHSAERAQINAAQRGMDAEDADLGARIAAELSGATAGLSARIGVERASGVEWPHLAQLMHVSLEHVQQIAAGLLATHENSWKLAREVHASFSGRTDACVVAMGEVRRQVGRRERSFEQAAQRFSDVAGRLLAWTGAIVPKLRLLQKRCATLRRAAMLKRHLPALESAKIEAEDELDAVVTELRKHRRHAQASRAHRSPRSSSASSSSRPPSDEVYGQQLELHMRAMEERVALVTGELRVCERQYHAAASQLPLELEREMEDGAVVLSASDPGGVAAATSDPMMVPVGIDTYHFIANWNNWRFEEMIEDIAAPAGTYYCEAKLRRHGGEFQIIRNMDWEQVFCPDDIDDDDGDNAYWRLDGEPGDVFRIELQAASDNDDSSVKVSWMLLRNEALDEESLALATIPTYSVVGSWDNWEEAVDMEWDGIGSCYRFYFQLGSQGSVSFQILKDGFWEQTLHPNCRDANPHCFHTLQGPSFGAHGLNWTVGKHKLDMPEYGALYAVRLVVTNSGQEAVRVDWERIEASEALDEASWSSFRKGP